MKTNRITKSPRNIIGHRFGLLLALLGLISINMLVTPRSAHAQVVGAWDPTGSLNAPRDGHTATLLPDGKVLVVGGANGAGFVKTAELYDPSTGQWSNTGSLNTGRSNHTATLLPDGKVLVAGGWNGGVLNSAELYDSSSGNWSVTGSLNTGRSNHTATLLPDGKVLVAGGWNGGVPNSAELYDSSSGNWSITASLKTGRFSHTATLLPEGKVLVTGGFTGVFTQGNCPCFSFVSNSAEIYDPATAIWSVISHLNTARGLHTATLLQNGKVLVAGGTEGRLIDIGEFVPLTSAELYDPTTGRWRITASLNTARNLHTATRLSNGKVLAAAGYYTDSAELYDQETGTWSLTGSLNTTRVGHTATLLPNGKVVVASGGGFNFNSASAEIYDPTGVGTVTLPLMIGAGVLPDAEVGVAYDASLVNGGRPPYSVTILQGALPPGLSDTLATGTLSGTPVSNTSSRSFIAQITDDRGSSVAGTFTLKILRKLDNVTRTLKTGTKGRPYKATLKAAGGRKPYTWSLVSGNLPAGLTLNSLTGAIAGVPTETGAFDLIFHTTDSLGGIAETALTLTIK